MSQTAYHSLLQNPPGTGLGFHSCSPDLSLTLKEAGWDWLGLSVLVGKAPVWKLGILGVTSALSDVSQSALLHLGWSQPRLSKAKEGQQTVNGKRQGAVVPGSSQSCMTCFLPQHDTGP